MQLDTVNDYLQRAIHDLVPILKTSNDYQVAVEDQTAVLRTHYLASKIMGMINSAIKIDKFFDEPIEKKYLDYSTFKKFCEYHDVKRKFPYSLKALYKQLKDNDIVYPPRLKDEWIEMSRAQAMSRWKASRLTLIPRRKVIVLNHRRLLLSRD